MSDQTELAAMRRQRLQEWMHRTNTNQSSLASRLGVGRAYVSLIFKPDRFFGEKSARSIEKKLYLPTGYLDSTQDMSTSVSTWDLVSSLPDGIMATIPRITLSVSIESNEVEDVHTLLPDLSFSKQWLKSRGVTNRSDLRMIEMKSDAMADYLLDGDVVVIDKGQKAIQDHQVYCLRYLDELRVKRLSRRFDGGLVIKSDNAKFSEESLSHDDASKLEIIGKVICRIG